MNLQLNKWYFDFTSEVHTGYYYIMGLRIGFARIGASGIYHFNEQENINSFKLAASYTASQHGLFLPNAQMKMETGKANLKIKHKDAELSGRWIIKSAPVKRISKPLYTDNCGWCDWKVWSAYSDVDIEINYQKKLTSLKGSGYIDLVRFAIPFWKIPLRSIYWGRLHCGSSWIVLFNMTSTQKNISYYFDPGNIYPDVSVSTDSDSSGNIKSFDWIINSGQGLLKISAETSKCLENQLLLDRKPFSKFLSWKILQRLGSYGSDRKYLVNSCINGKIYSGIMEEVIWDE